MSESTIDQSTTREDGSRAMTDDASAIAESSMDAPLAGSLRPVATGERIEILDILRGFAILGILMVNMDLFFLPFATEFTGSSWWGAPIDVLASDFIHFVAQGKFFTMFSFLFGIGLAIQMERAEAKGQRVGSFFRRRLFMLLLIGVFHGFVLWFGDILAQYAALGFLLLLFRRRKAKTLKIWAAILLVLLPLLVIVGTGFQLAMLDIPAAAQDMQDAIAEREEETATRIADLFEAYGNGSVGEVFAARASETLIVYTYTLAGGWAILAMFILGLHFGRIGFFKNLRQKLPTLRRATSWLLPLGLVGSGLYVYSSHRSVPMEPSVWAGVSKVSFFIAGPALCFAYIFLVCMAVQSPLGGRVFSALAPVGRMALTNYLTHSVLMTTLSYSYGFGLYGRVPTSTGLVMTFCLFGLQILFSHWWLKRYRFGPAEWLWRSLTYGERQPMRKGLP
ncbi:MAG: DUF418 domain-containing protein [Acidobacteriota bacterium]